MAPSYGAIRTGGQRDIVKMKKTTVWLSPREVAALEHLAARSGRSHSHLIRSAIALLAASARWGSTRPKPDGLEWFTRQEETVIALTNARYTEAQIARELRVSESDVRSLRSSIERRKRQFRQRREAMPH